MQREASVPCRDPAAFVGASAPVPVSPDRRRTGAADIARLDGDRVEKPVDEGVAADRRRQVRKIALP